MRNSPNSSVIYLSAHKTIGQETQEPFIKARLFTKEELNQQNTNEHLIGQKDVSLQVKLTRLLLVSAVI